MTPQEVFDAWLENGDKAAVERWWQEDGDMLAFLRILQARAKACPRADALMHKCGLAAVYAID